MNVKNFIEEKIVLFYTIKEVKGGNYSMNKWKIGMMLSTIGFLSLMNPVQAQEGNGNKIHYINVSPTNLGSDAILLESNGHYAMIDTGEDYDFPDDSDPRYPYRDGTNTDYRNVMTERVMRHLKNVGVETLDFILITHAHSDHIGNADELMENFNVNKVYMKRYSDSRITDKERLWDSQYNYDKVLAVASQKGIPVIQDISKEQAHFYLGDMDIQLYNYENKYTNGQLTPVVDDNSNSIISVITVNGKRIFTAGDLNNLDYLNEDRYGPIIGKVDMMKFNHHFDAEFSNTSNFLQHLHPSIVVQTSSSDPWKNQHVATDVINQLKSYGTQIIKASSAEYEATVFDIRTDGFVNISTQYPRIPSFTAKWYVEDDVWKYRYASGEHAIGWSEIAGRYYFFKGNGAMLESQWKKWRNRWFYLQDSGEMATKWKILNDSWYFFNVYGQMETGWASSDGQWYYLSKDGDMQKGWKWIDKAWYYFAESGEMKTGWVKDKDNWYYLDSEGKMKTGELQLEKQEYVLANDGHMLTGWNGNYYYRASGERAKEAWTEIDGQWYYFKANGELVKNGKTPDGYTVDAKGVWLKDIPQEVKKVQKETEKAKTTVENSQRSTHTESNYRREEVTRESNTSSVLEKHLNEENHSSSNPKHSVEEVTPTTSGTSEIAASSSRVEKEVGSNATVTLTVDGER